MRKVDGVCSASPESQPSRDSRRCRSAQLAEITAIASRDRARAEAAAEELGIPKAYGSYEELLADPDIDAVYNPLPNHLHVPWSIRAAEAGKHVLCEKPIGMNAAEAARTIAARDRTGVVSAKPSWSQRTRNGSRVGVGAQRAASATSASPSAPSAISAPKPKTSAISANTAAAALMDIGCYPIKMSRMVFGEEPVRVSARWCATRNSVPTS